MKISDKKFEALLEKYGAKTMESFDINQTIKFTKEQFKKIKELNKYALVMRIKKCKLGIDSDQYIDVVNMKCAPEIMDDLWYESGVFPAYHMSKKHWLTLTLDGSCNDETIKFVANISHTLTKKKIKKQRS